MVLEEIFYSITSYKCITCSLLLPRLALRYLTVWAVISGIGTASSHLVNLSMHVSKYVLPIDTGRGATISTCT